MNAGEIFPYRAFPATAGRVFENVHPSGNVVGLGVEASVGANATWELGFRIPPTVPAAGAAYLKLSMICDQTSDTAKVAMVDVKWASVALNTAKTSLSNLADDWTVSGVATEYYYNGTPPSEPNVCYRDGMPIKKGTLGSLAVGEWAWGDNDTLGASTVYVREPTAVDPDTSDSSTHIEVSSAGEAVSSSPASEGIFSVLSRGTADDDKWVTVFIPLDVDTVVGGEEIDMELVFQTTGWTLDVVSTWQASIVWLEAT